MNQFNTIKIFMGILDHKNIFTQNNKTVILHENTKNETQKFPDLG